MEEPTNEQTSAEETKVEGVDAQNTNVSEAEQTTQTGTENKEGQTTDKKVESEEKWGTFKTPDDLYNGYKNIQSEYTKIKQASAQFKEKADAFDKLLANDKFNEWVKSLEQEPEEDLSELSEEERIEKLVEKRLSERLQPIEKKLYLEDAEKQIQQVASKYKDFDEHIDRIIEMSKNEKYFGVPLEDLYKIATYEKTLEKGKQEALRSLELKKKATTESSTSTQKTVSDRIAKNAFEAYQQAKESLGK